MRHSLKLMSWNINHQRDKIEGVKFEIGEVQKLIAGHDIVCLQETKGQVSMRDFKCFNANRSDSKSGGVCTAIRKHLAAGVVRVHFSNCDDILIVKLKAKYFNLDKDLNLINVYDSPAHGSYKKRMRSKMEEYTTTCEHLEECLSNIPDSEDAAILGDMNARTGTLNDFLIPCESREIQVELDPPQHSISLTEVAPRNNQDRTLNSNGKPFIELLQTTGMIILNGRTIGDIFGSPTCIQRNGVSTVDYICVPHSLLHRARIFKVGDLTPYSDHRPIFTTLTTNIRNNVMAGDIANEMELKFASIPKPFKWTKDACSGPGTTEKFKSAQNTAQFNEKVDSLLQTNISSPDDIRSFNEIVIATFTNLASQVTTQKSGKPSTNKNKWFDWSCRHAKRLVCRDERAKNNTHIDPMLVESNRARFYLRKKEYRAQTRARKGAYLYKLNEKINHGNNINWAALKDLSSACKDPDTFDIYDLVTFHKFFNDLYNQKCKDPSHGGLQTNTSTHEAGEQGTEYHRETPVELEKLNTEFTIQELETVINKLQNNKSVSCDLISNEMLKSSKLGLQKVLLKLFNGCLTQGIYPWNCSITTPLHKKGDKQNPDNYRAITVGSCLGKLFASLLLQRLIEFRKVICPDFPYQLGFRAGAQCSDHILTLTTIIEKYTKKLKKKIFACFVDYRKAFDTVCREALMYKLSRLGIGGSFFSCLQNMYSNSVTRIKLIQRLSETIDVTIGTEQGHPMSPELFKIYIYDLSIRLAALDDLSIPELNGFPVSHLLWADDLILLALDANSLQRQLDCLHEFATKWELSINIDKTKVLVFNSSSRLLKCSYGFKLGDLDISSAKAYCYLGIQFSLNGSFKCAMNELRKKALRAFFSIRRMVDTRALTTKTMLKLIDSLVKPVATYACQIWLPCTKMAKEMARADGSRQNLARAATKDALETTHMKMLKWVLGLHKKANNNFCYGDTGRLPWALSVLPQCLRYFDRLSQTSPDVSSVNFLVHQTFQEQKNLNLSWYETWNSIAQSESKAAKHAPTNQHRAEGTTPTAHGNLVDDFVNDWRTDLASQKKMQFYCTIKQVFGEEQYLNLKNSQCRMHLAKIRSSSHDLLIERGRYTKETGTWTRACRFCCNKENVQGFENLPFFEGTIIENEEHCLTECPMYHSARLSLSDNLKSLLLLKEYGAIMNSAHVQELGKFLCNCHRIRNPKKMLALSVTPSGLTTQQTQ